MSPDPLPAHDPGPPPLAMLMCAVSLLGLVSSCTALGRDEVILREPLGMCSDADINGSNPPQCTVTYHIAATGGSDDNSGLSAGEPWETFPHAWQVMQPGNCLEVGDGTYTRALEPTVSGTEGAPIVIRAATDGEAIVDGLLSHVPCRFGNAANETLRHVYIEGLRCQNGQPNAVRIQNASHITLKRVSASNADLQEPVFFLWSAEDVVLEDVAGSGTGRSIFDALSSSRVVFRRCFGIYSNGAGENYVLGLRGVDQSLVENCILTNGTAVAGGAHGLIINRADWNMSPSRDNVVFGSIIFDVHRNGIVVTSQKRTIETVNVLNSVIVGAGDYALFQRSGDLGIEDLTIADNTIGISVATEPDPPGETKDPGFSLNLTGDSSFITGGRCGVNISEPQYLGVVDVDYFAFHNVDDPYCTDAQAGPNDSVVQDLPFDTQRFGKGAYAMRPEPLQSSGKDGTMGADVLYRSRDAAITDCPLWPWPMEDRIRAETGISVTWEAFGGLWKSLDDVYP